MTLGLNRWEFEVWTLWCHSPSASTHQLSAGEMHQPERETERKAAYKVSIRTSTTFRESLGFIRLLLSKIEDGGSCILATASKETVSAAKTMICMFIVYLIVNKISSSCYM